MKSKTIVKAFDSINPSQMQKDRMLQQILRQMPEQAQMPNRMNRNTYVTEPVKHSRRSFIPAIAACLAVCVIGGLGIGMLKNGQSLSPSSAEPSFSAVPATQPQDSTETALTGANAYYGTILNKYATALRDNWDVAQCHNADISPQIIQEDVRDKLGFCLRDLDGNGIEELIISDGEQVYDVFTILSNDGVGHLFCASENVFLKLCEGNVINRQETVDGATYWQFYTLVNDFDFSIQEAVVLRDGQYFSGPSDTNVQPISKDEAGNIIVSKYPKLKLDISPLPEPIGEDSYQETLPTTQAYEEILSVFDRAISEKWNMQQCSDAGISLMIANLTEYGVDFGYALMDLDGNGNQELLITDGKTIYNVYTLTDEGVSHVLTGWERNAFSLCKDNILYRHGSGGAALSYDTFYRLVNGMLVVDDAVIFDASTDPENPWFRSTDGETLGDPISQDQAEAIINSYTPVEIPFRAISDRP